MKKPIEKIKLTPELKDHYKKVGLFLKKHPEINHKKWVLGFSVDVGTIPDELVMEWLEVTKFDYKQIDK